MFLFFVSVFAVVSCTVLILFLKFASPSDKQHQQQQCEIPVDAITFLRSIRSIKPFPISSIYGWKVYCVVNDTRVWKRNLIIDNSGHRIQVIGCFVKLSASVQVVTKALKDVTRFIEWRPGVESTTQCGGGSDKQYGCVSHDFINLVMTNQKQSTYSVVVEQKNIERYWKRENNGCFWMLETSNTGLLFYILQPVEELESCCLTIVSHFTFPVTLQDTATKVSALAQSMRDYMLYRKMKVTPLLNVHIPRAKTVSASKTNNSAIPSDLPLVISTMSDLSDSSLYSSSEDDTLDNDFYRKFSVLDPKEKYMVLQKSDFILNPRSNRLRSHSDTNTGAQSTNIVKQRSSTLPKDMMSSKSDHNTLDKILSNSTLDNFNLGLDEDDVFEDSNTHNDINTMHKLDNTHTAVISESKDDTHEKLTVRQVSKHHNSLSSLQDRNGKRNDSSSLPKVIPITSYANDVKPQTLLEDWNDTLQNSPNNITYLTFANQCAADLLSEYLQVSNIDLKKPTTQQSASSGGWAFCGLENDVVILKKTPVDGSTVVSYMGKGLIHASPHTVLETVKNPRTKFTYDETLKKVDVLKDVTDKVKIVYFYHEVINMFKKSCYDFCVIQTERQDGDKYVLASESVETGLPNPVGVQRVQMKSSGWIVEPVERDNKTYSVVTYVIQVDFGMSKTSVDRPAVEELVSKQALSIAFIRQFLKPAQWKARNHSSPVRRQQLSPVPQQQSSPVTRHKSSLPMTSTRQRLSPWQQSSDINQQSSVTSD